MSNNTSIATEENNFVQVDKNCFTGVVKSNLPFTTSPEKVKEFFWAKDAIFCKDGRKVRAVCYQDYFIKSYKINGLFNFIRRIFKTSRPMKVLKAFLQLEKHNILTPRVLVAVTEKKSNLPIVDYLVTEKIPTHAKFANVLLAEYKNEPNFDFAISDKWIFTAFSFIAKMHEANVLHGDLNLRNFYYTGDILKQDGAWGIIDLDGANVYSKKLSNNLRTKDLASFIMGYWKIRNRGDNFDTQLIEEMVQEYEKITCTSINRQLFNKRMIYLHKRFQRFLEKYNKKNNK